MSAKTMIKRSNGGPSLTPSVFNDFFKPWNEWFNTSDLWKGVTLPAVNIIENKNNYKVSMAVPGFKKNDFKIAVEENILTISSEKEEQKEENEEKCTRKEYNYSSFSRSFTLPNMVNKDKIEAIYEGGILNLILPKKEEAKNSSAKQISVK